MIGEQIYYNRDKEIKYLLKKKESDFLVVMFSGYSVHPTIKAPYNYTLSLQETNINQLYISDSYGYDGRGCWYLGENGDSSIEDSVIKLINHVTNILNINKSNVILGGTSKGGFAALYFGIKYKFNNIIAGAPQIFLEKYLNKLNNKEILKCIKGEKSNLKSYDEKIIELNLEDFSNIYLLCGRKDYHLTEHIIPFIEKNNFKSNINLEIFYGDHGTIGDIFKTELPLIINDIILGKHVHSKINLPCNIKISDEFNVKNYIDILNKDLVDIKLLKNKLITYSNVINLTCKYACYLFCDGEVVEKIFYKNNPYFEFNIDEIGDYELMWFIKDKEERIISFKFKIGFKLEKV